MPREVYSFSKVTQLVSGCGTSRIQNWGCQMHFHVPDISLPPALPPSDGPRQMGYRVGCSSAPLSLHP